jgi:hypothetical protein
VSVRFSSLSFGEKGRLTVRSEPTGKHRKHPGGRGLAGGQHHHRINFGKADLSSLIILSGRRSAREKGGNDIERQVEI